MIRTRFAPSPTGPLHLGHAYAAKVANDLAFRNGGQFLIRIEDLDHSRARQHWEDQIFEDLAWLGITTTKTILRQSERAPAYAQALDHLWAMGVLYPCTCKRRDIEAAIAAPQEGASAFGPDGLIYPGTCRSKVRPSLRPTDVALRLDAQKAFSIVGKASVSYSELGSAGTGTVMNKAEFVQSIGDPVLQRKDMAAAYHLAVVVDDAAQGITHVTRGSDLAKATFIHRLLQILLDVPAPMYLHHDLIRDAYGKRLAKRDDAKSIAAYRDQGLTPPDVLAMLPTN